MSGFNMGEFCANTSNILQFVGWIVTIIKIAIPLLIIGFGILDFGKAVTGGDTKNIQESFKKFGIRILAGLIIFFLPSIVMWLFQLIDTYSTAGNGFDKCRICVLRPWDCSANDLTW